MAHKTEKHKIASVEGFFFLEGNYASRDRDGDEGDGKNIRLFSFKQTWPIKDSFHMQSKLKFTGLSEQMHDGLYDSK